MSTAQENFQAQEDFQAQLEQLVEDIFGFVEGFPAAE
jgi:hypothetical protein